MANLTIEIKLTGKAKILQFLVRLEPNTPRTIDVTLFTIDGGKTWTDKDILIETDKDLDVHLVVKAFGKVDWEFVMVDQDTKKDLCKESGTTGDGDGTDPMPNVSSRDIVIPIMTDDKKPKEDTTDTIAENNIASTDT